MFRISQSKWPEMFFWSPVLILKKKKSGPSFEDEYYFQSLVLRVILFLVFFSKIHSYFLCVYVFSVFWIVTETSTEASLALGIDTLYSTNSWPGVHNAQAVVLLGFNHKKGPWLSSMPGICMRVPDSCLISRACF